MCRKGDRAVSHTVQPICVNLGLPSGRSNFHPILGTQKYLSSELSQDPMKQPFYSFLGQSHNKGFRQSGVAIPVVLQLPLKIILFSSKFPTKFSNSGFPKEKSIYLKYVCFSFAFVFHTFALRRVRILGRNIYPRTIHLSV